MGFLLAASVKSEGYGQGKWHHDQFPIQMEQLCFDRKNIAFFWL